MNPMKIRVALLLLGAGFTMYRCTDDDSGDGDDTNDSGATGDADTDTNTEDTTLTCAPGRVCCCNICD